MLRSGGRRLRRGEQLDGAGEAGFVRLDLGPRTLRAEIAPVVALTTLWNLWG